MSTIDPQDARDAADEILAKPEYRDRPQSLVDRAANWLLEQLADVLSAVVGGGGGVVFGYTLLAVAAVAALYFLWRFLPRRRLAGSGDNIGIGIEIVARKSRDQWLAEALEAQTDGRWADAVRARYHALTVGLADAKELSPEPSTTSGEHRHHFAEVAASAPVRQARFEETVGRYESVWFGEEPADNADIEAATNADQHLIPPT